MATYGNAIYQYQDPSEVDISMLGKAVQFKQQNYDTNTMNVQSLVNQYLNMDLARDIDKEYLGERLNTLVNYVNGSGQKDWSRGKVARDISSYIGNAVDENVTRAVASTKSYRKQMEEIEELRKKDPSLVHHANIYNATKDWNRYLSSEQLGDYYRPQSYKNYVDVEKKILENAPKLLKDFGTQVVYTPENGGNIYFQKIGKREVITKEDSEKMLDMILGNDGKMQIFMNEDFNNQSLKYNEIKEKYSNHIDNKIDVEKNKLVNMQASLGGASEADKKILKNNIDVISKNMANLSKLKTTEQSRDAMLYGMGVDNFLNGWSEVFKQNKLIDITTDDSNFQILQFQQKQENDNFNNKLKSMEFEHKVNQDTFSNDLAVKNYELAKFKAQADGQIDANGNVILPGANAVNVETPLKDGEEYTIANVEKDYKTAYNEAVNNVEKDLADPKKRELLEKEFGDLSKLSAQQIAWSFIGRGGISKAQDRYNRAGDKGLFSEETLNAFTKAQGGYNMWTKANKGVDELAKNVEEFARQDISIYNKKEKYMHSDYHIDKNGKIQNTGKEYEKASYGKLSKYEQIGVQLNTITRLIKEDSSNKSVAALSKVRDKLILQLPKDQQAKAREVYRFDGFWGGLAKGISSSWQALFSGSDKRDFYVNKMKKGYSEAGSQITDMFKESYDLDDLSVAKFSEFKDSTTGNYISVQDFFDKRIKGSIDKLDNNVQNLRKTYTSSKSLTLDTSIKANQDMLSLAKGYLPTVDIPTGASISLVMNSETNTATMNVPVVLGSGKDKTTSIESVEIPLASIPSRILSNVDFKKESSMYDVNAQAMSHTWNPEILDTKKQVKENYGSKYVNPIEHGFYSKEDFMELAERSFGKSDFKKHKSAIEKIINENLSVVARPVNNSTYVLDVSVGNDITTTDLRKTNIGGDIKTIGSEVNKIVSEKILEKISNLKK